MAIATPWELVRRVNGRPWTRRQIGWFIVREASNFDQYGEYAADYWSARVEPGRYPLYAFRDCGTPWHSLGCAMPAAIVSGSWWNKRQPGEPTTVHVNPRAYSVAREAIAGTLANIELLPEVTAERIDFDGGFTHGLFIDGERV